MSERTVDMIVAVHDVRRDIRRAVSSILRDDDPTIRALVICHNLTRDVVAAELADILENSGSRVRLEELHDGVPSPSGPFNHGLEISDADYVGIMGSDDELDAGAITQWRRVAERHRADAVIAKVVRGDQRTLVRSPPKRVWRTGPLSFSRDRLSYRSAPLGLMRRDAVRKLQLRLLDGARSGGDLPFVTRLWALGRVVPAQGLGAYVEHADAPVRVTWEPKPLHQELYAMRDLLGSAFVRSLSRADRDALGTKLLRRNLGDSVRIRDGGRALTPADIDAFRDIVSRIRRLSPRSIDFISIAQRRVVDELLRPQPNLEAVARHSERMIEPKRWDTVLPARLRHALHPQGQTRYVFASALIKVGASRYLPLARNLGLVLIAAAVVVLIAVVRRATR